MTKILHCKVENILGVESVEFSPNGNSVTIGGENGQGKSSAIKALVMALGGKGMMPSDPVRHGAASGQTIVELDNIKVSLEVLPDRTSSLRVESKDGARYSTPQAMLDKLFGNLAFDPGEFKALPREKQIAVLTKISGIDSSLLMKNKVDIELAVEARRDKKHVVANLQAKLGGSEKFDSDPMEEIPISALLDELHAAQAHNRQHNEIVSQAVACEHAVARVCEAMKQLDRRYRDLEKELDDIQEDIKNAEVERMEAERRGRALRAEAEAFKQIECDDIHKRLNGLEEINKRARANKEYVKLASAARDANIQLDLEEAKIDELRQSRAQMLVESKLPIEGLQFDGDALSYKGTPFAQLSESEQWEISTAIGFSLNKGGIVFVSNSGGLDKKSRERVRQRAAQLGVQLFLEVVDDQTDVQVLIEEGKVKEDRL